MISKYTISQYATDLTPVSRLIQDRLGGDDLAIPGMINVTMMMMIVKVIMMTCTTVMMMMSILGGRVFGYF